MVSKKLAILIYLLLVVLVVASLVIFYMFFHKNNNNELKALNESLVEELKNNKNLSVRRDVLVKQNEFWANADKLRGEGKYDLAILEYEKAIGVATIPEEVGVIK